MITLSQILGFVSLVTVFGSLQVKNIKLVLFLQIICNVSGGACYILDGHISACALYFAAVIQSLVFLGYRLFGKETPKYLVWIFAGFFVLCAVLTFRVPADVLSMIAALICALALAQKNSTVYRILMFINGSAWLAYDIVTAKYEMIPSHILTAAAAIVGIARLDLKIGSKNNTKTVNK